MDWRKKTAAQAGASTVPALVRPAFTYVKRLHLAEVAPIRVEHLMKTKSNAITDLGWPVSFWFAVLSPALGILIGFLHYSFSFAENPASTVAFR